MKWHNLKKNKCPKCDKDTALKSPFEYISATGMLVHECGFKISKKRYKEIVTSMVESDLDDEDN